ncbi:MAG: type II toxin-antitoxin system VapC family toxin [Candidatus Methanoperedens sp.]|nr:type II toxin-antitoxin system VapC family toxin [Candidatus Methanoperedens sp.]MCZ7404724.1 type II toxin-antitoxin system VapC family toxin [Candidatus Methanoperedens sp.]
MIFIDTDIFVIEKLFKDDNRYSTAKEFLNGDIKDKCTSIYNLFELLGIASFNLNTSDLKKLLKGFPEVYDIKILFPSTAYESPDAFIEQLFDKTFSKISLKMNFMDALILSVAEEHNCSKFVTYNVKHFEGRTDIPVMTPDEILTRKKTGS